MDGERTGISGKAKKSNDRQWRYRAVRFMERHSMQMNAVELHGMQFHSMACNGMACNGIPLNVRECSSVLFPAMPFQDMQADRMSGHGNTGQFFFTEQALDRTRGMS